MLSAHYTSVHCKQYIYFLIMTIRGDRVQPIHFESLCNCVCVISMCTTMA